MSKTKVFPSKKEVEDKLPISFRTYDEEESREDNNNSNDIISCAKCYSNPGKFRHLVNENGEFLCDACYRLFFPATAMCDENSRRKNSIFDKKKKKNDFNEEEECRLCLEKGYFRRCCSNFYCHDCYFKTGFCPGCEKRLQLTGIECNDKDDPGSLAVILSWILSAWMLTVFLGFITIYIVNETTLPTTVWGHTCQGWFPSCDLKICIDMTGNSLHGLPYLYKYCNDSTKEYFLGNACIFDWNLYRLTNQQIGYDFCYNDGGDNSLTFNSNTESSTSELGVYMYEENFSRSNNSTLVERWTRMKNAKVSKICGYNVNQSPKPWIKQKMIDDTALVFSGVHSRYAETIDVEVTYGGRLQFFLKLAPPIPEEEEDTSLCKSAYGDCDINLDYSLDKGKTWVTINTFRTWKYRDEHFTKIIQQLPKSSWSNATRFRWKQPKFDSSRDYWALDDIQILQYFSSDWMLGNEDHVSDLALNYNYKQEIRFDQLLNLQCCYNTEHCLPFLPLPINSTFSTIGNGQGTRSNDCELAKQSANLPIKGNNGFNIRREECYILFSLSIFILKSLYIRIIHDKKKQITIPKRARKSHHNNQLITSIFGKYKFVISSTQSWKIFLSLNLILPFILFILWFVATITFHPIYIFVLQNVRNIPIKRYYPTIINENNGDIGYKVFLKYILTSLQVIVLIGCIIAGIFLDFWFLYHPWKNILFYFPRGPKVIEIDTNPEYSFLQIVDDSNEARTKSKIRKRILSILPHSKIKIRIRLNEIKAIHPYSKIDCWVIYLLTIFGSFPFNSSCMILRSLWFTTTPTIATSTEYWSMTATTTNNIVKYLLPILGWISMLRSLIGSDLFVKFKSSCTWLLTSSHDKREDMGRALIQYRVWKLIQIWLMPLMMTIIIITAIIKPSLVTTNSSSTVFLMFLFTLTLTASILCAIGMLQGLPISTHFLFTTWPDYGYYIEYNDKIYFPCVFSCGYCGDMHSRHRILMLFLKNEEDDRMFRDILKKGRIKNN